MGKSAQARYGPENLDLLLCDKRRGITTGYRPFDYMRGHSRSGARPETLVVHRSWNKSAVKMNRSLRANLICPSLGYVKRHRRDMMIRTVRHAANRARRE